MRNGFSLLETLVCLFIICMLGVQVERYYYKFYAKGIEAQTVSSASDVILRMDYQNNYTLLYSISSTSVQNKSISVTSSESVKGGKNELLQLGSTASDQQFVGSEDNIQYWLERKPK